MEVVKTVTALAALLQLCAAFSPDQPAIDVSRYFEVMANSTCGEGDTPTLFEAQSTPGARSNCSSGEHEAPLMLDGDPGTSWQSETGATPVEITFTLREVSARYAPFSGETRWGRGWASS